MKRILWAALLGFLSVGVVSLAERVAFLHSSAYPAWLAIGRIDRLAPGTLAQLRVQSCGGKQPIEIVENQKQFLLRCGLWWPASKTWIVLRTPTNTAILEDPNAL
jgi:hypothetical protein